MRSPANGSALAFKKASLGGCAIPPGCDATGIYLYRQMPKLGMGDRHENNFDFLRVVAAIFVIYAHCYPLSGNEANGPSWGWLGVIIFFIISGYLICRSWSATQSPTRFIWSRFLRIFPGLACAILFGMFVIGPLATTLPIYEYFTNPDTWNYFGNLSVYNRMDALPSVFGNNPYPGAVNGSLWTLPIEFNCYIALFLAGFLGTLVYRNKLHLNALNGLHSSHGPFALRPVALLLAEAAIVLVFLFALSYPLDALLGRGTWFYFANFVAGVAFYTFRDKIKLDWRVALLLLLAWAALYSTPYSEYMWLLAIPYTVFCVAFTRFKNLHKFGTYGDFSYGMYIYAFPVQQMIANVLGKGIPPLLMFALALLFIVPLAVLSWKLVESKALGLKNRDPLELLTKAVKRAVPKRISGLL